MQRDTAAGRPRVAVPSAGSTQRLRRNVLRALTAIVALIASAGLTSAASASTPVARHQLVVVISSNHRVYDRPAGNEVGLVAARRPLTGEPTVLPMLARAVDRAGHSWLQVRLPGRTLADPRPPSIGWIRESGTQLRSSPWHLVVDLSARALTVYKDGRPVREFSAIIGKPSTPTPGGQYFVEEDVVLSRGQPGGPFALATSARSAVLNQFDGGPGQVAIHGRKNLGGQLGTAESHGCVRIRDVNVTWLAAHVGAGTPVTIS
jgi:lipoprotein-anchoring transpeptidase ErfK/SrfK